MPTALLALMAVTRVFVPGGSVTTTPPKFCADAREMVGKRGVLRTPRRFVRIGSRCRYFPRTSENDFEKLNRGSSFGARGMSHENPKTTNHAKTLTSASLARFIYASGSPWPWK